MHFVIIILLGFNILQLSIEIKIKMFYVKHCTNQLLLPNKSFVHSPRRLHLRKLIGCGAMRPRLHDAAARSAGNPDGTFRGMGGVGAIMSTIIFHAILYHTSTNKSAQVLKPCIPCTMFARQVSFLTLSSIIFYIIYYDNCILLNSTQSHHFYL